MADENRELDGVTTSMSVLALNNLVVSLRPVVQQAKVHIVSKLSKQIKLWKKRHGSEEQKEAFNKKAARLADEITALKKVNNDRLAKFALGNTLTLDEAAKKFQNDHEIRVMVRISTHQLVTNRVKPWRDERDDWKDLAAFALQKNTGRRIKNKSKASLEKQGGIICDLYKTDEKAEEAAIGESGDKSDGESGDKDDDKSGEESSKESGEESDEESGEHKDEDQEDKEISDSEKDPISEEESEEESSAAQNAKDTTVESDKKETVDDIASIVSQELAKEKKLAEQKVKSPAKQATKEKELTKRKEQPQEKKVKGTEITPKQKHLPNSAQKSQGKNVKAAETLKKKATEEKPASETVAKEEVKQVETNPESFVSQMDLSELPATSEISVPKWIDTLEDPAPKKRKRDAFFERGSDEEESSEDEDEENNSEEEEEMSDSRQFNGKRSFTEQRGRGGGRGRGRGRGEGGRGRGRGRGGEGGLGSGRGRGKPGRFEKDDRPFKFVKGKKVYQKDSGRFDQSNKFSKPYSKPNNKESYNKPSNNGPAVTEPANQEKMHPSWEAARKRKQQSIIPAATGKKIKFDD